MKQLGLSHAFLNSYHHYSLKGLIQRLSTITYSEAFQAQLQRCKVVFEGSVKLSNYQTVVKMLEQCLNILKISRSLTIKAALSGNLERKRLKLCMFQSPMQFPFSFQKCSLAEHYVNAMEDCTTMVVHAVKILYNFHGL